MLAYTEQAGRPGENRPERLPRCEKFRFRARRGNVAKAQRPGGFRNVFACV